MLETNVYVCSLFCGKETNSEIQDTFDSVKAQYE